jgi:hypothetical protein
VLTFKQGEDEGIDEAWDCFNELLERGPNLGFSGDLMLHTFYFSLTPNSSRFVSVTTPSEIIPYYRLNHSFWSLSDNRESSH